MRDDGRRNVVACREIACLARVNEVLVVLREHPHHDRERPAPAARDERGQGPGAGDGNEDGDERSGLMDGARMPRMTLAPAQEQRPRHEAEQCGAESVPGIPISCVQREHRECRESDQPQTSAPQCRGDRRGEHDRRPQPDRGIEHGGLGGFERLEPDDRPQARVHEDTERERQHAETRHRGDRPSRPEQVLGVGQDRDREQRGEHDLDPGIGHDERREDRPPLALLDRRDRAHTDGKPRAAQQRTADEARYENH